MDLRAQRAVENEKVFRRINERVDALTTGASLTLVCECATVACVERIPDVPHDLYERVRSDGRRFFVVAGHEQPDVEIVVETHPGYLVVEKPAA